jgi:Ni/Fe-hydrogenase 1 B-type cytochrome subunit
MTIIEPVRKDIQNPPAVKKHSSALRFWHWANVIIISGSLLTVLLNSTLLNGNTNAYFIKTALQKTNVSTTIDQSRSVAHAIRDKVWRIHTYFGYGLAALLLFRLVLEFFQKADQKFIRNLKSAYSKYKIAKNHGLTRHELAVKSIYMLFYLLLIVMVVTGLILAFDEFKSIRPKIKNIHGFCMYLVLSFIIVHLGGVFLAERKDSKGIVSDMINGGDIQK